MTFKFFQIKSLDKTLGYLSRLLIYEVYLGSQLRLIPLNSSNLKGLALFGHKTCIFPSIHFSSNSRKWINCKLLQKQIFPKYADNNFSIPILRKYYKYIHSRFQNLICEFIFFNISLMASDHLIREFGRHVNGI